MPAIEPLTYDQLSVLIPTRGRVERLIRLVASFVDTRMDNSELVFRVDEDDRDTVNALLAWNLPHTSMLIGPRYEGYASMPKFFNDMVAVANGDVLMCGNDDMVFKMQGWDMAVLHRANKYRDGLFNLGVRTHNEEHYPFSIVSRKAVEAMGFLWDPSIFWGDIFLRDVMAYFGRCEMLYVEVQHDWAGFSPDLTFAQSDKNILARDPTYWTGTHAKAVAGAIDKLKGLMS